MIGGQCVAEKADARRNTVLAGSNPAHWPSILRRNKIGKAPAFQFYVKDWLSDPELQMTSSATRGVWINALCYMWESQERGKLEGTVDELAKILNSTNGDFEQFLKDVNNHKFADVTICNKKVTLINRRMYREQKERENTRLRVGKFRSNAKSNINVTPPSPSPTPTPTPKIEDIARSDKPKRAIALADNEFIQALKENPAYEGINIDREIGKLDAWLLTPRGKGKQRTRQRIVNWLNRAEKPVQIEKSNQPIESIKVVNRDGTIGEWKR